MVVAPEEAEREPVAREAGPEPPPLGWRVGALLFALRAVLDAVWLMLSDTRDGELLVSIAIDVGLAAALVVGWQRAVAICIVRAGLGWLYASLILLASTPPRVAAIVSAIELLGAIALVMPLWGRAPRGRVIASGVVFAGYAVAAVGAPFLIAAYGTDAEVTELEGTTLPYRLELPPTGWREPAEHSDVEAMLVREDVDAAIIVRTELGATPSEQALDRLEARALEDSQTRSEQATVLGQSEIPRGRVMHILERHGSTDYHVLVHIIVVPGVAYRIEAMVSDAHFRAMEAELRAILASFDPGQ